MSLRGESRVRVEVDFDDREQVGGGRQVGGVVQGQVGGVVQGRYVASTELVGLFQGHELIWLRDREVGN